MIVEFFAIEISNLFRDYLYLNDSENITDTQKCFFGFTELEFVGKVLSEEELKISHTKI